MSSDLMEYLAKDIIAEQEAKWQVRLEAELEAERAAHRQKEQMRADLTAEQEAKWQARIAELEARLEAERTAHLLGEHETLEALVSMRFPDAPMRLINVIRKITDTSRLQALRTAIPDLPDLVTLEQHLRDAAQA